MNARDREAARYRHEAAELRRQADVALDAGDRGAWQLLIERAILREEVADGLEAGRGAALLGANQRGKRKSMVDVQRLQVSKGKSDEGDPKGEGLQAKANAAGYTLRSLAEKLRAEGYRVSHPFLRQCLDGTASIRKPLAERIEALTGFRSSKAHWPKGWAREPKD